MPIDWVFFDMGGVLVDDEPAMLLVYRKLYEHCAALGCFRHHDEMLAVREQLVSEGDGSHWHTIGKRYLGDDGWWALHKELIDELRTRYTELNIPYLGSGKMLQGTASRYNIGLAANQITECRNVLKGNGWLEHFKVLGISEEVGHSKPHPEFFQWLLDQAGADAERCIMVGDRIDNDILPAKSLGFRTILLQIKPDYSLLTLSDDFARAYIASHRRAAIKTTGPSNEHEMPDFQAASAEDVLEGIEAIARK